jgi:hypothetical protein
MENKVKIWGKEINSCSFCDYCSWYEPRCLKGRFELNEAGDSINKHCPFSRKITKEIIESYGFELIDNMSNDSEWTFMFTKDKKYQINFDICSSNLMHISLFSGIEWYRLFRGKINNAIELEFIFRSIMLIE